MLYQLYETQRALLSPFSEFAAASAKLYNHPLSPFTHTPMVPAVDVVAAPLLLQTVLFLALAAGAVVVIRRRDLHLPA
jgi:poly-beta-hydroxyalkanoate depolymerase